MEEQAFFAPRGRRQTYRRRGVTVFVRVAPWDQALQKEKPYTQGYLYRDVPQAPPPPPDELRPADRVALEYLHSIKPPAVMPQRFIEFLWRHYQQTQKMTPQIDAEVPLHSDVG